MLRSFLDYYRATILRQAEGLDAEQLADHARALDPDDRRDRQAHDHRGELVVPEVLVRAPRPRVGAAGRLRRRPGLGVPHCGRGRPWDLLVDRFQSVVAECDSESTARWPPPRGWTSLASGRAATARWPRCAGSWCTWSRSTPGTPATPTSSGSRSTAPRPLRRGPEARTPPGLGAGRRPVLRLDQQLHDAVPDALPDRAARPVGRPPRAWSSAATGVGLLLGSFTGGYWGDRFGHRPVLLLASTIGGLGTVAIPWAPTWTFAVGDAGALATSAPPGASRPERSPRWPWSAATGVRRSPSAARPPTPAS